jgi:CRISPR-associated protein Cmr4
MTINYTYLYLLSPLHTGGTTQYGNLLGIARESHTNFPYIPSSSIRGRLRASVEDKNQKFKLFGTDLDNTSQLEQGTIWIGDGSLLWLPVPSLSHGVVWISCPMLLKRWARFNNKLNKIPVRLVRK